MGELFDVDLESSATREAVGDDAHAGLEAVEVFVDGDFLVGDVGVDEIQADRIVEAPISVGTEGKGRSNPRGVGGRGSRSSEFELMPQ